MSFCKKTNVLFFEIWAECAKCYAANTYLIECKFTELSEEYFPECQSSWGSTTVQHNELTTPWKEKLQATAGSLLWSKAGSETNTSAPGVSSYIHAHAELSSDLAAGHLFYLRGLSSALNIVERNFSVIYLVLPLKPLPLSTDHRCFIMIPTRLLSWPEASHDLLTKWRKQKEYYPFPYNIKFPLRVGLSILLWGRRYTNTRFNNTNMA